MKNEKRMIDADELIKRLQKSHESHARNSREVALLYRDIRIINEQPTVDAVVLPCQKGAVLIHDNQKCVADHWNILLTAFNEEKQVRLLDLDEVEAALAKMDGERKDNGKID